MRLSANKYQFSEVFVLGHQDALILMRHGHKPLIAGFGINGNGRQGVVALSNEKGLE